MPKCFSNISRLEPSDSLRREGSRRRISRTIIDTNGSKATAHLSLVSSASKFGVCAGEKDVFGRSISIYLHVRRSNLIVAVAFRAILDTSIGKTFSKAGSNAKLNGHVIAIQFVVGCFQSSIADVVKAALVCAITDNRRGGQR